MYIKIYFGILATFIIAITLPATITVLPLEQTTIINIINNLSTLLVLVGVGGYAWKKKIFSELVWRMFFVVEIIESTALFYPTSKVLIENNIASVSALAIGTTFAIPAIVFLYLYAFKSPEIWEKDIE